MKVFLLNCFLMLAFLSLIGCSQNQKSVNLQVSASFTVGAAGFTGGLIAYGEGPNGAKFAVSSGTGKSINTTIVDGTWKIYVMGWEDPNNFKFRGTKYCGMSEVNLASNDASVNITLSEANCESGTTFVTETEPKAVLISSCAGFYSYDTGTDSYSIPDSDTFCSSLPTALQASFEYYRLALPTIQGATVSPGIRSECIVAKGHGGPKLDIPTKKFPFRVMMFRSLQDCMDPTNPRMSVFGFLNGLEDGNQPSFDHHYYASGGDARLFLPTSMTRRGYSPFMGMMPRILCGSSDCFAKPILPAFSPGSPFHFNPKWGQDSWDNSRNTIIKGFKPTDDTSTCDGTTKNFLNQDPYFSIKECSIENGDLKGKFIRNPLTCNSGGNEFSKAIDLYERNGKIYVVSNDPGLYQNWISIYSDRGVLENNIAISSDTYKGMAVDNSGKIYVVSYAAATATSLRIYSGNSTLGPYSSSNTSYASLADVTDIEIDNNGTIFVGAADAMKAFTISGSTFSSAVSASLGSGEVIKKMLFRGSKIFTLTNHGSDSTFYEVALSSGTLTGTTLKTFTSVTQVSFHMSMIGKTSYVAFVNTYLDTYALSNLSTSITSTISANAHSLIMLGNMIYRLNGATSLAFNANKFNPATSSMISANNITPGLCVGQITQVVSATNPAYTLNLRSSNSASIDILFDEAFRYLGRRDVESDQTFYYFQSLAEGDKDNGPNAGGILGKVEQMLGPDGVGGVINGLYPGKTCSQIKDDVIPATGSVTKSATLYDIIDGSTQTVAISLSKQSMPAMGSFVGSPDDSAIPYDFTVTVSMVGKSDKMKFKLKCGSKRGSLESMGYKVSDKESRDLILWNTISADSSYEQYSLEDYKDYNADIKTRASVTRLVKDDDLSNPPKIQVRKLEIERNNTAASPSIVGSAMELALDDDSGQKLMTTKVSTGQILITDWNNGSFTGTFGGDSVQSVITSESIGAITGLAGAGGGLAAITHDDAALCMYANETVPTSATLTLPCQVQTALISGASSLAGIESLDDLNVKTTDPGTSSSMGSTFAGIFELTH